MLPAAIPEWWRQRSQQPHAYHSMARRNDPPFAPTAQVVAGSTCRGWWVSLSPERAVSHAAESVLLPPAQRHRTTSRLYSGDPRSGREDVQLITGLLEKVAA